MHGHRHASLDIDMCAAIGELCSSDAATVVNGRPNLVFSQPALEDETMRVLARTRCLRTAHSWIWLLGFCVVHGSPGFRSGTCLIQEINSRCCRVLSRVPRSSMRVTV